MKTQTRLWLIVVVALLALSTMVAAQEEVTLEVWDFGGIEFEYLDSLLIPAFEAEYPNIKIVHLGVPEADYNLKIETAIAANEVPDITLQSYAYRLWRAGHVIPLTEFMERDGFSVDDFFPIAQSWNMLDGVFYSMPTNMHLWAMIINRDLWDAAGLAEPGIDDIITFDQWLEYARAINVPADNIEERVWGSNLFWPQWNSMNNYMSDPYILGPDGRDCLTYAQTEDWLHTWNTLFTAYNEELVPDANPSLTADFTGDLFLQGKVGMTYGNEANVLEAVKRGMRVDYVGQPVVTPGWHGNVGAWNEGYGIMTQSEHPEEAWTFLKWLATDGALLREQADAGEQFAAANTSPPVYRPLAEVWAGDDPLRLEILAMHDRVVPPVFSPDIWTSVDPFYEAWSMMTQEGESVENAIAFAASECQYITDDLWDTWEFLAG